MCVYTYTHLIFSIKEDVIYWPNTPRGLPLPTRIVMLWRFWFPRWWMRNSCLLWNTHIFLMLVVWGRSQQSQYPAGPSEFKWVCLSSGKLGSRWTELSLCLFLLPTSSLSPSQSTLPSMSDKLVEGLFACSDCKKFHGLEDVVRT